MSKVLSRSFSNPYVSPTSRVDVSSFLISYYVCVGITTGFIVASNQFLHWFVIPVLLCGILISTDAVDWFRDRLDVFDPVSIVGLLGFHFYFLAPLLHVYWDYWMSYVVPPPEWRDWLGGMACLNFLGLLVYRFSRNVRLNSEKRKTEQTVWYLDKQRFFLIVSCALLVTGCLQLWVYMRFGGIIGYIAAYTEHNVINSFQGMGWIFMISESFPILAVMAYAVYAKEKPSGKSWPVLMLVLFGFLVLKLLFGGLRGSRSNTIWGVFWAIGIIHFWIRPIPKKLILVGCVFLVLFMFVYGFYKGAKSDVLRVIGNAEERAEFVLQSNRSFESVVLGDLGRSDIQSFLLYRILKYDSDYQYAWGRTYYGAALLLIPRSIWPGRPPTKVKEGTEAQYGSRTYVRGIRESSRVYGLAGETMLNFGPFLIPFSYLLLGFLVKYTRHFILMLKPVDCRLILLPFLINLCFIILVLDSDNVLFLLFKNGAVPFTVLMLSSTRFVVDESNNLSSNYECYRHD